MRFTAKDVTDVKVAQELQQVTGGAASVPVIVVDGAVVRGFNKKKLQHALGLS